MVSHLLDSANRCSSISPLNPIEVRMVKSDATNICTYYIRRININSICCRMLDFRRLGLKLTVQSTRWANYFLRQLRPNRLYILQKELAWHHD